MENYRISKFFILSVSVSVECYWHSTFLYWARKEGKWKCLQYSAKLVFLKETFHAELKQIKKDIYF